MNSSKTQTRKRIEMKCGTQLQNAESLTHDTMSENDMEIRIQCITV